MYQVLYRKWRPKVFSDVVGQPHVTVTLKNELQAGRIAHAYLFTGSRGTGKTTCAKILAKAINCLSPHDGDPCGECESCIGIDNGSIMDVVEIDAASNNGVENIRNLREEASFTPANSKYRVYIIDEVHMLSIGAFNALLKTLEEPPKHVVFILATTEVHKLPATILSRCQRFDFHRIPPEDISARLRFVAEQEGASIDNDAALLIARIADGALRDALSLLDQCIGRKKDITQSVVSETAGLASNEHLFSLVESVREHNINMAISTINDLHNSSKDMARLCEELIGYFRNIMLIKTISNSKDLVVVPADEYEKLENQAMALPLDEVVHAMDTLQTTLSAMFRGASRRVEMEMCMIKLCSPSLDDSVQALVQRISAIERTIRALKNTSTVPNYTQNSAVSNLDSKGSMPACKEDANLLQKPASVVDPPHTVNMEELQKNAKLMPEWPEVLQSLKSYSRTIASAFHDSVAYTSGDYVLIDSPNQMAFELLRKSAQRVKVRSIIQEVTGKTYKLGPYKSADQKTETIVDSFDELTQLAKDAGIDIKQI